MLQDRELLKMHSIDSNVIGNGERPLLCGLEVVGLRQALRGEQDLSRQNILFGVFWNRASAHKEAKNWRPDCVSSKGQIKEQALILQ